MYAKGAYLLAVNRHFASVSEELGDMPSGSYVFDVKII